MTTMWRIPCRPLALPRLSCLTGCPWPWPWAAAVELSPRASAMASAPILRDVMSFLPVDEDVRNIPGLGVLNPRHDPRTSAVGTALQRPLRHAGGLRCLAGPEAGHVEGQPGLAVGGRQGPDRREDGRRLGAQGGPVARAGV